MLTAEDKKIIVVICHCDDYEMTADEKKVFLFDKKSSGFCTKCGKIPKKLYIKSNKKIINIEDF